MGMPIFFKSNAWFRSTNKKMMDVMANHGSKIRRYMEKYGQDNVEEFIDVVHSIENLLDPSVLFHSPQLDANKEKFEQMAIQENSNEEDDGRSQTLRSFMNSEKRRQAKDQLELFLKMKMKIHLSSLMKNGKGLET